MEECAPLAIQKLGEIPVHWIWGAATPQVYSCGVLSAACCKA